MGQGCIELAAILATHPNKPWVTLGEMSLNCDPFLRQQITVTNPQLGLGEYSKRRWEHKNRLPETALAKPVSTKWPGHQTTGR